VARLFGLEPAPAAHARVLELGCGDGGNLLSLAQALPGASFVGIDASAAAIARGGELARAANVGNVELRRLDIQALPEDLGSFDYILSHGVYSWIPADARVALLAGVRRHLATAGIAYVSYNAYPGSYLRDMARDILTYHVRDIEDPQARLASAQELMQAIVAIDAPAPSPYAQVLREHMQRMLRYSDALLFHDDLAEIATPFYFYEFVEHAARHQLAFLSEADLFESQMRNVPDSVARLVMGLPDNVLIREQYLDFFKNRMFRQTLLCHASAPVRRELDDRQLERFAISSPARLMQEDAHAGRSEDAPNTPPAERFETAEGFSMSTSEPLVLAAMNALADAWPAALDFPTLLGCACQAVGLQAPVALVAARLRHVLLQAYIARVVLLHTCPPTLSARAGEHPLASPLVRAQCARGARVVTSLLHTSIKLEQDGDGALLELLDGTRDRQALAAELSRPLDEIDAALLRLASVGLLCG
jgi:SAM-dependent methyltransferase